MSTGRFYHIRIIMYSCSMLESKVCVRRVKMLNIIKEKQLSLVRRTANKTVNWVATQSNKGEDVCPNNWLRQPPSFWITYAPH